MLYTLLVCLAAVSADPAANVEVRFVYTAVESKDSPEVDVWIKQKLQRKKQRVFAMSNWRVLSAELETVHESNGMFIKAKAKKGKDGWKIEADGCAGVQISANVTYQPGQPKLYKVRGLQRTFMAVRTVNFVKAERLDWESP